MIKKRFPALKFIQKYVMVLIVESALLKAIKGKLPLKRDPAKSGSRKSRAQSREPKSLQKLKIRLSGYRSPHKKI